MTTMDEKSVTPVTPTFTKVEIAWPGFYLSFEATPERISRAMNYMGREALEAEAEHRAYRLQTPKQ